MGIQNLNAQIDSVKTDTGYKILPESILRPNTKITVANLQTSSNGTCSTPDISEQKYMSLSDMNNIILKKVEALTLHLIEQNKQLIELQK
jgi:hypothetical protein